MMVIKSENDLKKLKKNELVFYLENLDKKIPRTHINRSFVDEYKKKMLINLGVIGGTIFALYFLYIQFFILDALCKYCMIIDIGMLINLGIIILWKEKKKIPKFN